MYALSDVDRSFYRMPREHSLLDAFARTTRPRNPDPKQASQLTVCQACATNSFSLSASSAIGSLHEHSFRISRWLNLPIALGG